MNGEYGKAIYIFMLRITTSKFVLGRSTYIIILIVKMINSAYIPLAVPGMVAVMNGNLYTHYSMMINASSY